MIDGDGAQMRLRLPPTGQASELDRSNRSSRGKAGGPIWRNDRALGQAILEIVT